jgi:hypothetical protein
MTKHLLLSATAVAALAMAASAAQAAPAASTIVSGYAGIGFTNTWTTGNDTESWNDCEGTCIGKYHTTVNAPAFTLEGAASLPVTNLIGAQFDLGYGNVQMPTKETDTYNYTDTVDHSSFQTHSDDTTATAHVFARTDQWLAGAFVGETSSNGGQLFGGGVEGQYYCGRFTVQGSLGAATLASSDYNYYGRAFKPTVIAARLDGRYFITDDFSVGANAGYVGGNWSYSPNSNDHYSNNGGLWTVGVGAEYRIKNTPFTVLASYEHGDGTDNWKYLYSADSYFDHYHYRLTNDALRIGVRWTFGGSLFQRDRHGASLNSFSQSFGDGFLNDVLTNVGGDS